MGDFVGRMSRRRYPPDECLRRKALRFSVLRGLGRLRNSPLRGSDSTRRKRPALGMNEAAQRGQRRWLEDAVLVGRVERSETQQFVLGVETLGFLRQPNPRGLSAGPPPCRVPGDCYREWQFAARDRIAAARRSNMAAPNRKIACASGNLPRAEGRSELGEGTLLVVEAMFPCGGANCCSEERCRNSELRHRRSEVRQRSSEPRHRSSEVQHRSSELGHRSSARWRSGLKRASFGGPLLGHESFRRRL